MDDMESEIFRHMMRAAVLAVLLEIFEGSGEIDIYNIINEFASEFVKEEEEPILN